MIRYFRTPLDLPLLLFVVSALIGVWASYDPATSWRKFALIVAAVAIYYVIVAMRAAPRLLEIFVWFFLIGCAALAVYFVTQNNYADGEGKFGLITQLGLLLSRAVPQLPFHVSHPNVVAGALEIALPVNVALIAGQKSKAQGQKGAARFAFYFSFFPFALITFGLVMSTSRGAWLALAGVAVGATLIVVARNVLKRYALPVTLIVALIGLILVLQMGDEFSPALDALLGAIPAGNTAVSRLTVFGQARGLIQDYFFTGSGLGVFPMVFSTYALLIDVPFLTHAHNLFLQFWIEQGLLGFVASVWLVIEFYLWCQRIATNKRMNWLMLGGIAATTVMWLHGLVDVGLYSSRGLPLMFVPMGIAVASQQSDRGQKAENGKLVLSETENRQSKSGVVWLGVLLLLLAAYSSLCIGHPAASWYANLGSVAQTRVELGQSKWPDRLVEDVRRENGMQKAETNFQQALAFDAGNVTANQRLGEIALAQGRSAAAQDNLERAYQRDPLNRVTWQLLGDAYLAQGRLDDAYALWVRVPDAKSKLSSEAWVRYERHGDHVRAGWANELAERIGSTANEGR